MLISALTDVDLSISNADTRNAINNALTQLTVNSIKTGSVASRSGAAATLAGLISTVESASGSVLASAFLALPALFETDADAAHISAISDSSLSYSYPSGFNAVVGANTFPAASIGQQAISSSASAPPSSSVGGTLLGETTATARPIVAKSSVPLSFVGNEDRFTVTNTTTTVAAASSSDLQTSSKVFVVAEPTVRLRVLSLDVKIVDRKKKIVYKNAPDSIQYYVD